MALYCILSSLFGMAEKLKLAIVLVTTCYICVQCWKKVAGRFVSPPSFICMVLSLEPKSFFFPFLQGEHLVSRYDLLVTAHMLYFWFFFFNSMGLHRKLCKIAKKEASLFASIIAYAYLPPFILSFFLATMYHEPCNSRYSLTTF